MMKDEPNKKKMKKYRNVKIFASAIILMNQLKFQIKKICKIIRFFFPNDCESIGIYTTEDTDLEGFFIRS